MRSANLVFAGRHDVDLFEPAFADPCRPEQIFISKATLDQINLISTDLDASIAFYRRLGVEIPDTVVWRTPTGGHHLGVAVTSADQVFHLDVDSTVFAQTWISGWKGRIDLRGRVIVGFSLTTRVEVDDVFHDMTGAGYRGLQEPHDAIWGVALRGS
jgi:predicted lactoylglutathione lyase